MRLLKQISREYKNQEYEKHWIIIPNKIVQKLGWKEGNDLEAEIKDNKLIIKKEEIIK